MKKIYTGREFSKILKANNYKADRTRGSHTIFTNGERTLSINLISPNRMVIQRLIKEYQLTV